MLENGRSNTTHLGIHVHESWCGFLNCLKISQEMQELLFGWTMCQWTSCFCFPTRCILLFVFGCCWFLYLFVCCCCFFCIGMKCMRRYYPRRCQKQQQKSRSIVAHFAFLSFSGLRLGDFQCLILLFLPQHC